MARNSVPYSTPLSSRLDRDALMMMPRDTASTVAFELLDGLSMHKPAEALAGLAVAFAALVERVNMAPDEAFAVGRKVLNSQEAYGSSMATHRLDALRDFAKLRARSDHQYI